MLKRLHQRCVILGLFALFAALAAQGCTPSGAHGSSGSTPDVGSSTAPSDPSFVAICKEIAQDIEAMKRRFSPLADFDASSAITQADCHIDYTYHCHRSTSRGGWTAGVPNPDPDGVWFYIGLWDESDPREASSQINTQPVIPHWHLGTRKVTFLILEGEKSPKIAEAILDVLKKHGLRNGP